MKLRTLLLAFILLPVLAPAQRTYTVTALPLNGLDGNEFTYTALNNNGEVAGFDGSYNAYYLDTSQNFFFLGSVTGVSSYWYNWVTGLNDSDVETGYYAQVPGGFPKGGPPVVFYTPCVFSGAYNPNRFDLPFFSPQDGTLNGQATAINDAGQMVGYADGYDAFNNPFEHAALWSGGVIHDLGTIAGTVSSRAVAVNASGVAAGYAVDSGGNQYAALFSGGTATELAPLPGGSLTSAIAINSSGTVVGNGSDSSGYDQPLIWVGGTAQIIPGLSQAGGKSGGSSGQVYGIADDGTIVGASNINKNSGDTWIVYQGATYDLSTILGMSMIPIAVNGRGQILVQEVTNVKSKGGENPYYLLTPQGGSGLHVTVTQRVDGGTVPDGTKVKLLNNDGTPLSPPTSGTTSGGVVTFNSPPSPTAPNTSYEVVVCVPTGAKGLPAVQTGVSLGQTTVYYTAIEGHVVQSVTAASPVAYATCRIGGISVSTAPNGMTPSIWLPDGTYTSSSLSISPGRPCTFTVTLGATSSSNLTAQTGYAGFLAHMTRVYLTARNANGTTFIPKAGAWSISAGALSASVNGQATSPSWWLPNGTYTGTLSGAAENGSSTFNVGTATASGLRTITVSGP